MQVLVPEKGYDDENNKDLILKKEIVKLKNSFSKFAIKATTPQKGDTRFKGPFHRVMEGGRIVYGPHASMLQKKDT